MYFDDDETERDPFELFGDRAETNTDDRAQEITSQTEPAQPTSTVEPERPRPSGGFSWAAFTGGLAALLWIGGAIGGPLSYFGVDGVMAMDPAMQAGMLALAFGPALLFWVASAAAGEALKARRLTAHLVTQGPSFAFEAGEAHAQRLTQTVKTEIDALNDAVAGAMTRLGELESIAQRNAALFDHAVIASRENTQTMSQALRNEHDALVELNADMKGQTEVLSNSIGRQIRLMREASKLVKAEINAAEETFENQLSSFTATATVIGERTQDMQHAADSASVATASLNTTMSGMLEGLAEATRLTDAARQSTEQAVLAANETAAAVRETTRSAVTEAKRAAQLIRAETVAMQDAAGETLARLQQAANAARAASEESQTAADRHAATLEKRLNSLASTATAKRAPAPQRTVEQVVERPVVRQRVEANAELATLHAAANAAVTRNTRPQRAEAETQTQTQRRIFKGFGGWGNVLPPQTPRVDQSPAPANDDFALVDFDRPARNPDAALKADALDLVADAGVDLGSVLKPTDLERIASHSRNGANARRDAVIEAAPIAVNRIARHVRRNANAEKTAAAFRARPELATSDRKSEGSDLVRAYLLIDAALA